MRFDKQYEMTKKNGTALKFCSLCLPSHIKADYFAKQKKTKVKTYHRSGKGTSGNIIMNFGFKNKYQKW